MLLCIPNYSFNWTHICCPSDVSVCCYLARNLNSTAYNFFLGQMAEHLNLVFSHNFEIYLLTTAKCCHSPKEYFLCVNKFVCQMKRICMCMWLVAARTILPHPQKRLRNIFHRSTDRPNSFNLWKKEFWIIYCVKYAFHAVVYPMYPREIKCTLRKETDWNTQSVEKNGTVMLFLAFTQVEIKRIYFMLGFLREYHLLSCTWQK